MNAFYGTTPATAGPRLAALLATVAIGVFLATPTLAEKACRPPENLLKETDFAGLGAGDGSSVWRSRQHARGGSFRTEVVDGELTIEKLGKEPWFVLVQRLPGPGFQRRRIRYEVDLKLELTEPDIPHGFEYAGGLYFAALSIQKKLLLRSAMEQETRFGTTEWQRVVMEFDMPEKARDVEVGFMHQAGGILRARDPQLYIVYRNTCEPPLAPGSWKLDS